MLEHSLLNRLFTEHYFANLVSQRTETGFSKIVETFVPCPHGKTFAEIFREIYRYMSKQYRNEYFYKNTILNSLLLGRHSLRTTIALTQVPVAASKADLIMINGEAVVYEIKTELDNLNRLETQLNNYYTAFAKVCVVTSENKYQMLSEKFKDSPVGIYVLNKRGCISQRKLPLSCANRLRHWQIFELLRKQEFEHIIYSYCGKLPKCPAVYYYRECYSIFEQIPMTDLYPAMLKELKKRNKCTADILGLMPTELKALLYFSRCLLKYRSQIQTFLATDYIGG